MENMKYTMSYIAKNFRVALMLSLMMLLCANNVAFLELS